MKAVTWLGSWVALLVTAIIIAVLVITRCLPVLAAVVAVFAWAGEAGGVRIGKEVIRRDRPPQAIWLVRAHGWSFPSGMPRRRAWPSRSWPYASPCWPATERYG